LTAAPPVRAVVFDYGGVLTSGLTDHLAEVAAWHAVPMSRMLDVLLGPRERSTADHPWHLAERGELAMADLQSAVVPFAESAGLSLRGDEYATILGGEYRLNGAVVERIARLRSEGYGTALLTNSFREFDPTLRAQVDFALFDVVVASFEVGHRKPEQAIYALTTDMLGVEPAEIVYLDDFAANLDGARREGWRTVLVDDIAAALTELDAALTPRAGVPGGRETPSSPLER
jgi:epoxide hydrolase-like predicted phosphatase